jgi:seryl-tRNA synthetase
MHDIKFIRENPTNFDLGLKRRGLAPLSSKILELDKNRRFAQTQFQTLQAKRHDVSKKIGLFKKEEKNVQSLLDEVASLKSDLEQFEEQDKALGAQIYESLMSIPNLPSDDVPLGEDEGGNIELRKSGTIPHFDFQPLSHEEVGEKLGLMDFTTASDLSGSRFVILKGSLAKMERALGAFMLDHQTEQGYLEISPPLMVRDEALYGTGQLPKFGEDLFRTQTGHSLIPTAEVPLTNLVSGKIIDETSLPLRYTALTPCFRSEAGSAGKDTQGMIRQHQFYKVEMVSISHPDHSDAEHERMTKSAESLLNKLGLAYRVMLLCSGDMGFAAKKTYDIEVWLPSQNCYREISSCSNCGDFQTRRMNARYRPLGEKNTRFLHSLNGSGLAVGRTLIAILENYQRADGTIIVPEALQPYLRGMKVITANV